jgi:ElaB/YqjD/DUF883 family membrane-anchored ribosome-binding protein
MSGLDGLKETCEVAIKKLSQIPPRIIAAGSNADEVKSMNAEASRLQRDADTALRRLETEAKASAPSVRRQLVDTVAQLKASLGKAKNDLQQANDKAGRQELLGKAGKQKRLEEAKKFGDFLYVGIWDDEMTRFYKGEVYPILSL